NSSAASSNQSARYSAKDWRTNRRKSSGPSAMSNTPACPIRVWAHDPGGNAAGRRSNEHPNDSSSRARLPCKRMLVRCAETSTAAPSKAETIRPSSFSNSDGRVSILVSVTNHSSGPSQTSWPSVVWVQVLGSVGRAVPSARPSSSAPGPVGSIRRFTAATASSANTVNPSTWSESSARACRRLANGWVRYSGSAIATRSFRVDQHGFADLGSHEGAVVWHVHHLTDPGTTVLHQRQRERSAQFGAEVAGGDVSEHRHRRFGKPVVLAQFDDLGALRQSRPTVDGQQRDELFALWVVVLQPGEGAFADEVVLLLRHHPAHAQVLGGDRAVGVLPDDR